MNGTVAGSLEILRSHHEIRSRWRCCDTAMM